MFTTITNQRLLAFMAENDIHISGQDACYLIRLFDINGDGKLTYTEYILFKEFYLNCLDS